MASAIEAGCVAETLDAFSAIRNAIDPQMWVISQSFSHGGVIEEIAWDGGLSVASVGEGRILIWDIEQGGVFDEWIIPEGVGAAKRVAWNMDGTRLATGHTSGELIIWSAGMATTVIPAHLGAVNSVMWHPEKDVIMTGGDDGWIYIWEADKGEAIVAIEIGIGIYRVFWDSTGTRLAIADQDGSFSIWDVDEGWQATQSFAKNAYSPFFGTTDIRWGKDDQYILTVGTIGTEDFKPAAHLWQPNNHQVPVMAFGGHTGIYIWSAAFSPGGTRIATAGDDGEIRLWDVESGLIQSILRGHVGSVYSLIWLDETRLLSAGSDGILQLWTSTRGNELPVRQYAGQVSVLRWLDGETILSASHDGSGHLWRAADGAILMELHHNGPIFQAWTSDDGSQALTPSADGTVGVWDLAGRKDITYLGDGKGRYIFSRWERSLLIAGYECAKSVCGENRFEIHLWRAEKVLPGATPTPDLILIGHSDVIQTARWNPTDVIGKAGSRMATASFDGTIRIWDVALDSPTAGKTLQVLIHATPELSTTLSSMDRRVLEAKWNEDGSALLSYSRDGLARVWRWDSQKGEFVGSQLMRHDEPVRWAEWIENDQQIITTSDDGLVRIWNAGSGELIDTLSGHTAAIRSALWIDESKSRLLSVSDDATAILWDIPDRQVALRFVGHSDAIFGAKADEAQALLLTYGKDGTARLWDLTSGEELAILSGHKGSVSGVNWNPARTRIITGGEDGLVRQYYREMDDLIRGISISPTLGSDAILSTTLSPACETVEQNRDLQ